MELNHTVQLLYYLEKMGHTSLELTPELLTEKQQ
jgi:hypothetical protein